MRVHLVVPRDVLLVPAGVRDSRRQTGECPLQDHVGYIAELVERGGPRPEEYSELNDWISGLYLALDQGGGTADDIAAVRRAMAPVLAAPTMPGFAYSKPHGYAGDFEIIDRHYLTYVVPDPNLANWDHYWHSCAAARAVRNRKGYFQGLLQRRVEAADGRRVDVLNIASGPGRDVFDFLSLAPGSIHFECIDQDANAISHASKLCSAFSDRLVFRRANVLRFRPHKLYDVIWTGGLFDYFSDRVFKLLLRRLLPFLAPGGELVIGNFGLSRSHSNFHWLRFCEWILHHRTADQLRALANEAGASREQIRIGIEPAGVNLFLHVAAEPPSCRGSGGRISPTFNSTNT